jgi:hypothetical protein
MEKQQPAKKISENWPNNGQWKPQSEKYGIVFTCQQLFLLCYADE